MSEIDRCLQPTPIIDSDNPAVQQKANSLTRGQESIPEKARSLFYLVRDQIRYNPYSPFFPLQASATLERGEGFCIQKAILLTALARASGIPARLGFADIRNHIMPEKLLKIMGTNVFTYHGFTEFLIDEKWIKATPAFDLQMCQNNGIIPVEFDGLNHAIFHQYTEEGTLHIEYVRQHGSYEDVPVHDILDAAARQQGKEFVRCWETGEWGPILER
ncbi:MAG: transglutaminase-like domain-containing protein [Chloroflexota bacterium]